ncbi:MAG: hypothetical protein M1836_005490 [Candelina mexicana]|nr:MAG: hypothetical protein M1836_005490 [Candelina mexicana]
MASQLSQLHIFGLPSVRKQHLLVEFASLKYACPQGIYLSLTPGNPTTWSGVCFVRKGPYASAILRFRISFPPTYPALPPLITFTTDIFHPLITPLTTYTYTTGSASNETVSARDDERLPSGGFSLRDRFPHWFGRSRRCAQESGSSSRNVSGSIKSGDGDSSSQTQTSTESRPSALSPSATTTSSRSSLVARTSRSDGGSIRASPRKDDITIIEILQYMRSSFEDETLLDSLPIDTAGNPGAWHAWRSHRTRKGHTFEVPSQNKPTRDASSEGSGAKTPPADYQQLPGGMSAHGTRRPGEWSWDGVWEERVRRGINQSNSDAVLYGNMGGGNDVIRFLNMGDDMIAATKEDLKRSTNVAAVR